MLDSIYMENPIKSVLKEKSHSPRQQSKQDIPPFEVYTYNPTVDHKE